MRPETPGVLNLIVHALSKASQPPADALEVHAVAPLLVAPNPAVQQEMTSVFETMQAVVQQQLYAEGQHNTGAASKLTWSLHYRQLLWDIGTILNTTAAKPGCLPAAVAAGLLTGVLEFLGNHGCWCSISWLLAEAIKAKLLQHAKGPAQQRMQETQPIAGFQDAGLRCSGFIMDLASSPPPAGRSSPPQAMSRGRGILSALSAALAGKQPANKASGSSASAFYSAASASLLLYSDSTERANCSSSNASCRSSAFGSCQHDSCSDSSSSSITSFCSSTSLMSSGGSQALPQQPSGQQQVSRCQGCSMMLVLTAATLVLLLLYARQLLPCQLVSGQQLEGCIVSYQPRVVSLVSAAAAEHARVLLGMLLYAPFMGLLFLSLTLSSKVCLVL
jgi:hypothetical protein